MSALSPLYLLGLLAVAAPIIFHLIRRAPKGEVPFSSLLFLTPSPPRLTRRSRPPGFSVAKNLSRERSATKSGWSRRNASVAARGPRSQPVILLSSSRIGCQVVAQPWRWENGLGCEEARLTSARRCSRN